VVSKTTRAGNPKRIAEAQPEDRHRAAIGFFQMPEEAHGYWLCSFLSIITNVSDGVKYSFPYYFPLKSGVNIRVAESAPLLAD